MPLLRSGPEPVARSIGGGVRVLPHLLLLPARLTERLEFTGIDDAIAIGVHALETVTQQRVPLVRRQRRDFVEPRFHSLQPLAPLRRKILGRKALGEGGLDALDALDLLSLVLIEGKGCRWLSGRGRRDCLSLGNCRSNGGDRRHEREGENGPSGNGHGR